MDMQLSVSDQLRTGLAARLWCCDPPLQAGTGLGNSQEIKFSHFSRHRQGEGGKLGKYH